MNVALHVELLEEVRNFKHLGSKITADERIETYAKSRLKVI